MPGRKLLHSTLLLLSGIWLTGCIPFTSHRDDPYFAGYHRSDPSQGITIAIIDREALIPAAVPDQQSPASQQEEGEAYEDQDYTYPNWYRERYLNEYALQLNLSYYLYGPYYYHDFRTRHWLTHQRLPWYANGWWFDDLWWDYRLWHDWWYDPWYGYHYNPWYYDPYWYYQPSYGYIGYGRSYWSPWYGTYTVSSGQAKATEPRPLNRRDLPTGLFPGSDGTTTRVVTSQPSQSQSGDASTSSATQSAQRNNENGQAVSSQLTRPAQRQGNYTPSASTSSSSTRSSASTRSTSSSSSTARPAQREGNYTPSRNTSSSSSRPSATTRSTSSSGSNSSQRSSSSSTARPAEREP